MRVLFAWELGANLGHLTRDLPIAQGLRDRGHEVWFAVCNLDSAERMLAPAGFAFMPCPLPIQRKRLGHPPVNYSDIIAEHGFAEKSRLSAMVRAWIALIRTMGVDVLVSDFAPTALLAARVLQMRVEVIGPPFSVPPAVSPLPSIRPWDDIAHEQLRQADARVLTVMNDVLGEFGFSPLPDVASLFAGITPHLTHFAELDCYGPRTANYIGPVSARRALPRVEWQGTGRKRVFAYLHPALAGLEPLLEALQQVEAEVICVIVDAPDSMIDRLKRTGLNVRNTPVDLSVLLPEADVVVGYGSAGLIAESLMNGVPMVLVPLQIEHHLNAKKAAELGAAAIVDDQRTQTHFRETLRSTLANANHRDAARMFRAKNRALEPATAVDCIEASLVDLNAAEQCQHVGS